MDGDVQLRWGGSLALLCATLAMVLAACSSPGGQACDSDSDCPRAYRCVSSGGVLFGERICLLSGPAQSDADAADAAETTPALDASDASDASASDITEDSDASDAHADIGDDDGGANVDVSDVEPLEDTGPCACAIQGECYGAGEPNPGNPCLYCDPLQPNSWSVRLDGFECENDDGLACTGICSAGTCADTVRDGACLVDGGCYDDGVPNPDGPCEQCDASTDKHGWTIAEGASCDDGISCTYNGTCDDTGQCQTGVAAHDRCFIDQDCYDDGQVNPDNPCLRCDPFSDQYDWSVMEGAACDDGLSCTGQGTCDESGGCQQGTLSSGSCLISDACYSHGEDAPINECLYCNASQDPQGWTQKPFGSPCGSANCNCNQNAECRHQFGFICQ